MRFTSLDQVIESLEYGLNKDSLRHVLGYILRTQAAQGDQLNRMEHQGVTMSTSLGSLDLDVAALAKLVSDNTGLQIKLITALEKALASTISPATDTAVLSVMDSLKTANETLQAEVNKITLPPVVTEPTPTS